MADRADDGTVVGCNFCARNFSTEILYTDEDVIAVANLRNAGAAHWLLMPLKHIRDIEVLGKEHLPMLQKLDTLKHTLLSRHYPTTPAYSILSGYHRGQRPTGFSTFQFPDIISVHHLHLHVIVEPSWFASVLKYPWWFPWMWVSDEWVLSRLKGEGEAVSEVVGVEEGEREGEGESGVVEEAKRLRG
ncbi:MAG: Histidine triad nucleotide-binding protein 3 [Geoglossum umbratile]|nr:MAG: Histidine triad nucleotide-binding protein 3 [Geoglossum umbratile]